MNESLLTITLKPRRDNHTVRIKVELDYAETYTEVSEILPIGTAVEQAIRYAFSEKMRRELSKFIP